MRRSLEGWLRLVERKNGWQLVEAAGEATPYGMQRLLAGAHWERWGAVGQALHGHCLLSSHQPCPLSRRHGILSGDIL